LSIDDLRASVLGSLEEGGHRVLVSVLETGEWKLEGNELSIRAPASAAVIDMSFGTEAKRLASSAASRALGRTVKLQVLPGGAAQDSPPRLQSAANGSGRGRAEQDPVVRRMQEKFGAEIRTVIDYRERK
jgi:DNA polymerase-3 subunit gamma/tau